MNDIGELPVVWKSVIHDKVVMFRVLFGGVMTDKDGDLDLDLSSILSFDRENSLLVTIIVIMMMMMESYCDLG